jgi:hypothetical protein
MLWEEKGIAQWRLSLAISSKLPTGSSQLRTRSSSKAGASQTAEAQRVATVRIDPEHRVGAEALAQGRDQRHGPVQVGVRDLAFEVGRAVGLVDPMAVVDHGLDGHLTADAVRLNAVAEVVDEGNLPPHRAAEQVVDRPLPKLAANVPEGDLDPTEGANEGEIVDALDTAPGWQAGELQGGDVNGVAADEPLGQAFVDDAGALVRRRLAEADDALVGLDLDDGL